MKGLLMKYSASAHLSQPSAHSDEPQIIAGDQINRCSQGSAGGQADDVCEIEICC